MPGRSAGIVEALGELLPRSIRELFTLVTQLGDAWFLFAAVALFYWFGNRRRGAFALSAILGALALTVALKGLFALPRPPTSLHVGHASGYGFPSGHAIGATVAWSLFALIIERGTRHRRAVVAAAAVVLVSASRVVIGVHYVVDVAVGIVVGLVYLAVLLRVTRWSPTRGFAVAAVLGLAALATAGLAQDSVATVGGVLGAGATWVALDGPPGESIQTTAALAGLAALGALGYAANALSLSLPAVFVLSGSVPAGILVLPLAVERAKKARSASPT